jgi:hypothetical protein
MTCVGLVDIGLELARPPAKLVDEGGSCEIGAAVIGADHAMFARSAQPHSGVTPSRNISPIYSKETDSCPQKTKSAKHQSSSTQR